MTRTEVQRTIKMRLQEGQNREEVYKGLIREYDKPNVLATMISSIPPLARKQRYGWLNYLMLLLFTGFLGYNAWVILGSAEQYRSGMTGFLVAMGLLCVWVVWRTLQYKPQIYMILGFLSLMNIIHQWQRHGFTTEREFINLGLLVAVAALALWLRVKLFPGLGLLGPVKDEEGAYVFRD